MESQEHTLEFLLAFDGRRHWYEGGYYVRFQIKRVKATSERGTKGGPMYSRLQRRW